MTGPQDPRSDDAGTPLRSARSDVHPGDAPDDPSPGTVGAGAADVGEPGAPAADEPTTG